MLEAFEITVETNFVMGSLRISYFLTGTVRKINHLLLTHISQTRTTPALARTQKFCTLGSGNLTYGVYSHKYRLVSCMGAKPGQCQVLYYPDIALESNFATSTGY